MQPNLKYEKLADDKTVEETVASLRANSIEAVVVETGNQAKEKVLSMIPKKAEVMTMSSQTLEQTGIDEAINKSSEYDAVKPKLWAMDRNTQARQMAKLGAAPDWVIGSVQAITKDGKIVIASNTGSQLSAEAYAGGKVIFVVSTKKIVEDLDEAMKRIYEYSFPKENERAKKVYGMPSGVNKILIINKEVFPGRTTVILVKEDLGY
jgi:L-lactate utilization protein LutC